MKLKATIAGLFLVTSLTACGGKMVTVTTEYNSEGKVTSITHSMDDETYQIQKNIEASKEEVVAYHKDKESLYSGLTGEQRAIVVMAAKLAGEKAPSNYNDYLIAKEQEGTKRLGHWIGLGKSVVTTAGTVAGAYVVSDAIVDIASNAGTKITTQGDVDYVESGGTMTKTNTTTNTEIAETEVEEEVEVDVEEEVEVEVETPEVETPEVEIATE